MANRNPLVVIKNLLRAARDKAYYVEGLRDDDEIARSQLAKVRATISEQFFDLMMVDWIKQLNKNRKENNELDPDLFRDDFAISIRDHKTKTTKIVMLRDIRTEEDVAKITTQKRSNKDAVDAAFVMWTKACAIIVPIMVRDSCSWGEACDYLNKRGQLPRMGD